MNNKIKEILITTTIFSIVFITMYLVLFFNTSNNPTINISRNETYYNEPVSFVFTYAEALLNGEEYISNTLISEEGNHTLIIIDQYGNHLVNSFIIDYTAPMITGVEDGGKYNQVLSPEFNEGTALLNNQPYEMGTIINTEGDYELIVIDNAGNETRISFITDYTGPMVTGVEDGGIYDAPVRPIFGEGTATLNGEVYISKTKIFVYGDYELIITDEFGNQTIVNFEIYE